MGAHTPMGPGALWPGTWSLSVSKAAAAMTRSIHLLRDNLKHLCHSARQGWGLGRADRITCVRRLDWAVEQSLT